MLQKFTNLFPLWTIIIGILALIEPSLFTWFKGDLIKWGLAGIMLGMGLTLKPNDFKYIIQNPKWIIIGVLLQFTIMPLLGWSIANLTGWDPYLIAGIILVTCCPGGTASNVITYLAKGNVALSVGMTTISTLLAAVLTPYLTYYLIGNKLEVSAIALMQQTTQVVILPVALGLLFNLFLPKLAETTKNITPAIAVILIILIVGSILGARKTDVIEQGLYIFFIMTIIHSLGFILAYLLSKRLKAEKAISTSISIEVGMQNSGLGVVLAQSNFSNTITALPSAISAITHCLLGSLASYILKRI